MEHPGKADVVDIGAFAPDEAVILFALDALTDSVDV
jgi:hypothetical protein